MKKLIALICICLLFACEGEGPSGPEDNFDRKAMLTSWADNIIIPGYTALSQTTLALKNAGETFESDPTQANLDALRTAWENGYMAWQKVSMFNVGKADELRFRDQLNIYPTKVEEIEENIAQGGYNLLLPSQNDRQGFPALEYLLFGLGSDDPSILGFYTSDAQAGSYRTYVKDLTDRIHDLTSEVLADWTDNGFRESFINNDGNSETASVNLAVNDFVFYYEKHLRAGKVGIPAGVFSGNPLSTHVEAFYKKDLAKELLQTALQASQDFFNGKHFDSATEGEGMKSYITYLNTLKGGEDLSLLINNQLNSARTEIEKLNDDFAVQVESDNIALLSAYDQLQLAVVLFKVDMLQAFSIDVDY
ncbi:MAG: imelysin family protein, partial [Bacteroidota bacterium]